MLLCLNSTEKTQVTLIKIPALVACSFENLSQRLAEGLLHFWPEPQPQPLAAWLTVKKLVKVGVK